MKRWYFTAVILVTVLSFAFVWVRLQIVSISYEIHEFEKKEKILQDEVNRLTYNLEELKSPHNLEKLAIRKFNMRPPNADQVIVLQE